uniref:Uncharacterized protein n=1 Tax=Anopheles maculatus TaxID=74869 RepID=A0A182SLT5_9DIPT
MSIDPINVTAQTTHRYHTHSIHRSSTLLVEKIVQTTPQQPQLTTCYTNTISNATLATTAAKDQLNTTTYKCTETAEASHELLDFYLNDSNQEPSDAAENAFDRLDLKLHTLDFSLTRRLLGAVFFLLIIYAWKQYIDDEEESDTIYI